MYVKTAGMRTLRAATRFPSGLQEERHIPYRVDGRCPAGLRLALGRCVTCIY